MGDNTGTDVSAKALYRKKKTNQKELSVNSHGIFIGEQPLRDKPSRHLRPCLSLSLPPPCPAHAETRLPLRSH